MSNMARANIYLSMKFPRFNILDLNLHPVLSSSSRKEVPSERGINPGEMVPWNGAKTKVQLKLTSQRCTLLQEKKNAMAKKDRREIASLIERGKLETARVKTEGLYNGDIHIELLEIIELYAEMLIVSSRYRMFLVILD